MHKPRKLQQNVWYKVGTEINTGEPLFQLPWTKVLLHRVLRKVKRFYPFELRGLRLEGAWLTFYIKPEDGFMLPLIMQWLKQTFSLRFNIIVGRRGHVLGERYDSEILDGDPPEDAEAVDWAAIDKSANTPVAGVITYTLFWGSPRTNGMATNNRFLFAISPNPHPRPANSPLCGKKGITGSLKALGQRRGLPTPQHEVLKQPHLCSSASSAFICGET